MSATSQPLADSGLLQWREQDNRHPGWRVLFLDRLLRVVEGTSEDVR